VLSLLVRRHAAAINLALAIAVLWLVCLAIGSPALNRFATEMLIYVVAVVGLQIFVGNSGIVSFGHSAFMLIAAYATAWQTCCPGLKPLFLPGLPDFLLHTTVPSLPAALVSAGLAAICAGLVGLVLMRLSGIGASIALFAFLAMIRSIYENWSSWTGGAASLIGLPLYVTPLVVAAWAVVAVAVAVAFGESRFGLMLRASQDDLIAAHASGVPVYTLRVLALVLSAFFVGVAGVLLGHFLGALSVRTFWLDLTFLMLAMLIFGGRRSVTGAVVGAFTVRLLIAVFRILEAGVNLGPFRASIPAGTQELILAVAILLVLSRRPGGLLGAHELNWPLRSTAPGTP
jgi:branched-chain amino acid transport system permease protein